LAGCPQHIDSLYGLKVAGNGTGGALAIYEYSLGGNIYAQKISPEGKTLWGEKGALLGSSHSQSYSYFSLNIVSDDSGGAIAAWPDSDQFKPTTQVVRIDPAGQILWQRGFIYFDKLISDGAGGAILAFDYPGGEIIVGNTERDLLLVRVDSQGDYPWGLQGVAIKRQKYQDNTLQIVSDGSGGAIATWEEMDSQPNLTPGTTTSFTDRLIAQRIDSTGTLSWGDSVSLFTTPEGTWFESLQAAGDGKGGTIASWFQVTEVPADVNGPRSQIPDIAAQKVDADGKVLWQSSGVPLEIGGSAPNASARPSVLTGDGSGGAVLLWPDMRKATADRTNLFAQRLDAAGNIKWQAGGINVSLAALNLFCSIINAGDGNTIAAYSFLENGGNRQGLHVQQLNANGQTVWPENGVAVTDAIYASHVISPDGQGGAITAWGIGKGLFGSEKAYLQRIDSSGKLLWGENGIRLNP
jgi:hypothetical protein